MASLRIANMQSMPQDCKHLNSNLYSCIDIQIHVSIVYIYHIYTQYIYIYICIFISIQIIFAMCIRPYVMLVSAIAWYLLYAVF